MPKFLRKTADLLKVELVTAAAGLCLPPHGQSRIETIAAFPRTPLKTTRKREPSKSKSHKIRKIFSLHKRQTPGEGALGTKKTAVDEKPSGPAPPETRESTVEEAAEGGAVDAHQPDVCGDEMPEQLETGSAKNDADKENPLDAFADVINCIDLSKIQQTATMFKFDRMSSEQKRLMQLNDLLSLCCDISAVPRCGSYNLAYLITFQDETQWIARVPGHGHEERWTDLDQRKMDSEYNTMRYVRNHTTIPIPEVYYWNTDWGHASVPFALMELAEGKPLAELWMDDMTHQRRMGVLANVAEHMAQLYPLSFSKIGMLNFTQAGNMKVGENNSFEMFDFSPWHATHSRGPFFNFKDSLWDWFNEDEDIHIHQRAGHPILRRILQSTPECFDTGRYSINFADFNYQNIFLDADFRITGFIDWDGVHTEAPVAGCARYPSWITRDWDPIMYYPDEEGGSLEESPETLSMYRQHYSAEFIKHASAFDGFDPRMATLSHVMEAICIALTSPLNRCQILTKLLDHAFDGKTPFTKQEYVKAYTQGQRSRFDRLIEEALPNLWRAEWEKVDDAENEV